MNGNSRFRQCFSLPSPSSDLKIPNVKGRKEPYMRKGVNIDWDELQIENLAWQQAILSVSFVEAPLGCINVYRLNDLNI